MPDRMMSEDLLDDKKLRQCTEDAQTMYQRLILRGPDDYGNFEIDPVVICAGLYRFLPRHTPEMVFSRFQELEHAGAVLIYEDRGIVYGHLRFEKRQGKRYHAKSPIPAPPWAVAPSRTSVLANFPTLAEFFTTSAKVSETFAECRKVSVEERWCEEKRGEGKRGEVKEPAAEPQGQPAPSSSASPSRQPLTPEPTEPTRIPPEVLSGAERFLSRPLAKRDRDCLTRYAAAHPAEWILAAMDMPRAAGKPLEYLAPMLEEFAAKGGPQHQSRGKSPQPHSNEPLCRAHMPPEKDPWELPGYDPTAVQP